MHTDDLVISAAAAAPGPINNALPIPALSMDQGQSGADGLESSCPNGWTHEVKMTPGLVPSTTEGEGEGEQGLDSSGM